MEVQVQILKQQPEQKKSVSTPGFEAICGIVGILAVFCVKENKKVKYENRMDKRI